MGQGSLEQRTAYRGATVTRPSFRSRKTHGGMICLISSALLLQLAYIGKPTAASPAWTFCVASALGTHDVWLSSLFVATTDREKLETEFRSLLERQGHSRIVAQCPQPSEDKVSVLNAQTVAEDFNRKLGSALHGVPARDFPPR